MHPCPFFESVCFDACGVADNAQILKSEFGIRKCRGLVEPQRCSCFIRGQNQDLRFRRLRSKSSSLDATTTSGALVGVIEIGQRSLLDAA